MALYAFDGTGNEDHEGTLKDSNVLMFFNAYEDPLKTQEPGENGRSLYLKGIGTRAKEIVGKTLAEQFGIGGHKRIGDALARLDKNFDAGDTNIDVTGFSRGAALAISFANELAKKHPERQIRFIGVFDIVGEFGAPGQHFNAGHDLHFPPNVKRCYHAMAMDEHRALFQLTRLTGSGANEQGRLVEAWFRGVHSDVGGGNDNPHLNWIALNWMYQNAVREGLPISKAAIAENLARRKDPQEVSRKLEVGLPRNIRKPDLIHASVVLDKGPDPVHAHNNPSFACARIDDAGKIAPV
jgi:uncharacterized protein (DUF2235 family)